jgi:hypothetical protein
MSLLGYGTQISEKPKAYELISNRDFKVYRYYAI